MQNIPYHQEVNREKPVKYDNVIPMRNPSRIREPWLEGSHCFPSRIDPPEIMYQSKFILCLHELQK